MEEWETAAWMQIAELLSYDKQLTAEVWANLKQETIYAVFRPTFLSLQGRQFSAIAIDIQATNWVTGIQFNSTLKFVTAPRGNFSTDDITIKAYGHVGVGMYTVELAQLKKSLERKGYHMRGEVRGEARVDFLMNNSLKFQVRRALMQKGVAGRLKNTTVQP